MERLVVMQALEEKTSKRIQFLKNQLEAINDGNFSIDERVGTVKFDNVELCIPWDQTERW